LKSGNEIFIHIAGKPKTRRCPTLSHIFHSSQYQDRVVRYTWGVTSRIPVTTWVDASDETNPHDTGLRFGGGGGVAHVFGKPCV